MADRPTVVLLHGLARTQRSMASLRRHLEAQGYPTWARTYPSRKRPVAELAELVAEWVLAEVPGEPACVTHSLGGILARHMGERVPWRRLCMLAPPNNGSRVARAMADNPLFKWVYGPAGQEVGDPAGWPVPRAPVAVIAGTVRRSVSNPPSWLTAGLGLIAADVPSDGTVAVEETRLAGMVDFATVEANHTWIMDHPQAREMILRFLETGRLTEPLLLEGPG